MLIYAVFILIMMVVLRNAAKKQAERLRDESELEKDEALRDVLIQTAAKKEKHATLFGWLAVVIPLLILSFLGLLFSDAFY